MKATRAIIWKEWREGLKWALVPAVLMLWSLSTADHRGTGNFMESTLGWTLFVAPLFGLALGLLQVLPELRRDQWGFLVHRPVPTAKLCDGKVFVGALLMLLFLGVPYAVTALWFAIPGHVDGPFDIRFLYPGIADMLIGFVFYLAALVTAIRPARWHGSRALPLIGAALCMALALQAEQFWQALAVLAAAITLFWATARSSFAAKGEFRPQPRLGRFGLAAVLYISAVPLIALLVWGAGTFFLGAKPAPATWRHYEVFVDNHPFRVTRSDVSVGRDGRPWYMDAAADLGGIRVWDGKPVVAPSGQPDNVVNPETFFPKIEPVSYHSLRTLYTHLTTEDDKASHGLFEWYLPANSDRLLAYSVSDNRYAGSLGPDGFSTNPAGLGSTHSENALHHLYIGKSLSMVWNQRAAYLVDRPNRRMTSLFPMAANERIFGACRDDWYTTSSEFDARILFVTTNRIVAVDLDGRSAMSLPVACDPGTCSQISVYRMVRRNRYVFWYERNGLPNIAVETDGTGKQVARRDVPNLGPVLVTKPLWGESAMLGLMAPPVAAPYFLIPHAGQDPNSDALPIGKLARIVFCGTEALAGALCALLAYLIGLRCGWDRRGRFAWVVGTFWLGLPGVLMLLCVDRWPARETCANCAKKRVVNRDLCEHCGAAWPAPGWTGTEIFDGTAPTGAFDTRLPRIGLSKRSGTGSVAAPKHWGGPMRAMIRKELHENFLWTIFAATGIGNYASSVAHNSGGGDRFMEPMLAWTVVCGPIAGALLGALQTMRELRPDRRAFLIHRPASVSTLFCGKVAAGFILYLIAVGLPFAAINVWMATPGHIAEPWRFATALPGIADIACGALFYFAGMLATLRPARWEGSRAFGFAAAAICLGLVLVLREFYQAMLAVMCFLVPLAFAAYGAFAAPAEYGDQPKVGRIASAVTAWAALYALLTAGVCYMEIAIISTGTFTSHKSEAQSKPDNGFQYDIDGGGRILRIKSGATAYQLMNHTSRCSLEPRPNREASYRDTQFSWFYTNAAGPDRRLFMGTEGRILVYAKHAKRLIGSIGPDGVTTSARGPGFTGTASSVFTDGLYVMQTRDALYTVAFPSCKVARIVSVSAPDAILSTSDLYINKTEPIIVIATHKEVRGVRVSGDTVFTAPIDWTLTADYRVSVGQLDNPDHFYLWYEGPKWPQIVNIVDRRGHQLSRMELPRPPVHAAPAAHPPMSLAAFGAVTPAILLPGDVWQIPWLQRWPFGDAQNSSPGDLRSLYWLATPFRGEPVHAPVVALSLLSGLIAGVLAYGRGRRFGWDKRRRLAWAFGVFWLGFPGLLMLMALQPVPARERCPVCGKKRVVTRNTCEHCGAPFQTLKRDGTEIFEIAA